MEIGEVYQEGIIFLKEKKYLKAVSMFEMVFKIEGDPQSFEALFSSLISLITELRAQNQDFTPELKKLKSLMQHANAPKEVLGFSYSTLTKSKLTKRFKFLALLFHPDKTPENSDYFIQLKAAYDQLISMDFDNPEPHTKKFFYQRTPAEFEYNDECFCNLNPFLLCSFFPMMMLFFISIYSTFDGFTYGYSFEKTLRYTQCTETRKYNISFCYSPEDLEFYTEIEKRAEQDWLESLARICEVQLNRASYLNPESLSHYPVNLTSCEILKSLESS